MHTFNSKSILAIIPLTVVFTKSEAFASQKGWRSRPVIPELAKTSEDENLLKSEKKKERWDPIRFLSQSSKFVSMPKPSLPGTKRSFSVSPGDVIWSSSSSDVKFEFAPLDDVVMGGVSSSTFEGAKWSGTVSDSNSGGFVGIRTTPFANPLDMSTCEGIELKMKGCNDKILKAVIRDSTDFNGVCWTATFGGKPKVGLNLFTGINRNTEYTERTFRISFDDLIPTIFARTVPGQNLNKKTIEGFQIAFSKFLFDGELNKAFSLGNFELTLLEIKAY